MMTNRLEVPIDLKLGSDDVTIEFLAVKLTELGVEIDDVLQTDDDVMEYEDEIGNKFRITIQSEEVVIESDHPKELIKLFKYLSLFL